MKILNTVIPQKCEIDRYNNFTFLQYEHSLDDIASNVVHDYESGIFADEILINFHTDWAVEIGNLTVLACYTPPSKYTSYHMGCRIFVLVLIFNVTVNNFSVISELVLMG